MFDSSNAITKQSKHKPVFPVFDIGLKKLFTVLLVVLSMCTLRQYCMYNQLHHINPTIHAFLFISFHCLIQMILFHYIPLVTKRIFFWGGLNRVGILKSSRPSICKHNIERSKNCKLPRVLILKFELMFNIICNLIKIQSTFSAQRGY